MTINSPCTKKCNLNKNDICTGCYRMKSEIIVWKNLNDLARMCVINNTKQRKIDNNK